MLRKIIAVIVTAIPILVHADDGGRFAWVLDYAGQSENALVLDKRTKPMIQQRVPALLSRDLLTGLSGPPDPVFIHENRYVSMSACAHRFCLWKGFFWIDTTTGVGLGAVWGLHYPPDHTLRLASNGMRTGRIPSAAHDALVDWLSEFELRPEKVVFAGSTGDWSEIDAGAFQPRDRYRPAARGPSFDCGSASGVIPLTICRSPQLSWADLELFRLAEEIRRGNSRVPAREELAALQNDWIRARDAECSAVTDMEACLDAHFRAQREVLRHWTPRRPAARPPASQ